MNKRRRHPKITRDLMVFVCLIEDVSYCAGRVFADGDVFYLGVDPAPVDDIFNYDCATFHPIIFSWTTDAEIWRGRWKLTGQHCDCPMDFPTPEHIVGIDGELKVEGFFRDYVRDFDVFKDGNLSYRISRSPIRLENVAKAKNGICEWEEFYYDMLFE